MKIGTDRLEMTQITVKDWDLYLSLNRNPAVIKFCFDEPLPKEIEGNFNSRLPVWSKVSEHWLCLTMTVNATGEKIGVTGFRMRDGVAEVGFLIQPKYHGFGYGTESLKSLINWAYEEQGILSFNAVVTEGNIGSEKVLIKCGFSLKEVSPDAYEIGSKLYADHVYQYEKIVL